MLIVQVDTFTLGAAQSGEKENGSQAAENNRDIKDNPDGSMSIADESMNIATRSQQASDSDASGSVASIHSAGRGELSNIQQNGCVTRSDSVIPIY